MKQRILEYTKDGYTVITNSTDSSLLIYMQEFLESLTPEQIEQGPQAFNLTQINDFIIDYGRKTGDTFYIAFWNLIDSRPYETTMQDGTKILHEHKIPKLKLSYQNFEYIFKRWKEIKQSQPLYLIISQDNTGFVHLYDKQQLDIEEIALVEQHKKEIARWNNQRLKNLKSQN